MSLRASRLLRALAVVLMVLGGAAFVVRGPARCSNFDFALLYASARGWCLGADPYDATALDVLWHEAQGVARLAPTRRGARDLLYVPSMHVPMAPVAMLPWPAASRVWLGLSIACVPLALAAVARHAGLRATAAPFWLFVGGGLLLAPFHTSVALGQLAVPVLALIAGAELARHHGRDVLAGLLLGLAAALKPQIGGLFVLHALLRRRWRCALLAGALAAVVLLIGVLRLQWAGIAWLATLQANVTYFATEGMGNPTVTNPARFQLLDLHPLYHTALDDRGLVNGLVLLTVGAMAIAFIARAWWQGRPLDDQRSLAMTGVLGLLVVYHRIYDAVLLVFVLAWCLRMLQASGVQAGHPSDDTSRRARIGTAIAALAALAAFLTPGGAFVQRLAAGAAPDTWWWHGLLLPHQTWALLALGVILIVAPASRTGPEGAP